LKLKVYASGYAGGELKVGKFEKLKIEMGLFGAMFLPLFPKDCRSKT